MGLTTGPIDPNAGLYAAEHHEHIRPARMALLGAIGVVAIVAAGEHFIEPIKTGLDAMGAWITMMAGRVE